MKNLMWIWPSE